VEKDIYKMTKNKERKLRDIIEDKCIKVETEGFLLNDEEIKNRWRPTKKFGVKGRQETVCRYKRG
jgi:hypothetical protein